MNAVREGEVDDIICVGKNFQDRKLGTFFNE